MYRIYTTYEFLGRSEVEGNEKLFNTSVYVKSKGFDCLELVNPVWFSILAVCVITIASFNHQKFNINDTMIGAVEVDRDWVRFLSLYGRDMIRKAKTKFGLSLSHIL